MKKRNKYNQSSFEIFQNELSDYLIGYKKGLAIRFTKPTVNKHIQVLQDFIEYVTLYEGCNDLGSITKAMTASKLANHINSQGDDFYTTVTVKNIVDAFLRFIYETYGIRNSKLTR